MRGGGLALEEGETQDCSFAAGEQLGHIRIEVASVDDDVEYDETAFAPADEVEGIVTGQMTGQGIQCDVSCPGVLLGEVGAKLDCSVETTDGQTSPVTWSAPELVVP